MAFKKNLIPLMIGIFFIYPSFGSTASKVQLSVVYTNDVMGEVEPCG
jgi:hypothetical protein